VRASVLAKDHDIGRLQIAVKNAAFVRRLQCGGNLARQPHSIFSSDRTAERLSFEIFENEVVGSDVVDLANVMVDRAVSERIMGQREDRTGRRR